MGILQEIFQIPDDQPGDDPGSDPGDKPGVHRDVLLDHPIGEDGLYFSDEDEAILDEVWAGIAARMKAEKLAAKLAAQQLPNGNPTDTQ